MSKHRSQLIVIFLTLTTFVYLASLLGAVDRVEAATATITGSEVNVRSGPGTQYPVMGSIYAKNMVTTLETSDAWTRIESGNMQGWVNNQFLSTSEPGLLASPTLKVMLNGNPVSFEVPPHLENNRVLVPLRAVFDAIGATINWDQTTQTATVTRANLEIVMPINSTHATVNGQVWEMDVPARMVQQRIMIPLGFVGKTLDGSAGWEPDTNTVYLAYPPAAGLTPLSVKVVSAKVNLRSGPGTAYSIVGAAVSGEELPILAQQNAFYQVNRAGTEAWVASWVIDVVWGYNVQWNP